MGVALPELTLTKHHHFKISQNIPVVTQMDIKTHTNEILKYHKTITDLIPPQAILHNVQLQLNQLDTQLQEHHQQIMRIELLLLINYENLTCLYDHKDLLDVNLRNENILHMAYQIH